jgi:hypothetical protein
MQPLQFEINFDGRWFTIRTCGGPLGAFCGLTGKSPRKCNWICLNERETIIEGCMVRQLN